MKYTIEFRDGLRYVEKEIDGILPRVGDNIRLDSVVYDVIGVLIDLSYSEPVYTVNLKKLLEANFEN